jgi:hypothetical protein
VALADQIEHLPVKPTGLDEVGYDNRIGGSARGPELAVSLDLVGIDRVKPQFGAASNERLKRSGHLKTLVRFNGKYHCSLYTPVEAMVSPSELRHGRGWAAD